MDLQVLQVLLVLLDLQGQGVKEEEMDHQGMLASGESMVPWVPLVSLDLLENLEGLDCLEYLVPRGILVVLDPKEVQVFRDQEGSLASLANLATQG